jgi:hypothetical protein
VLINFLYGEGRDPFKMSKQLIMEEEMRVI